MVAGFSLFGGSDQDDFIDLTSPNVRRKRLSQKQLKEIRDNTQARELSEFREQNILGAVERARQSQFRQLRGEQMPNFVEEGKQKILADAKAGQQALSKEQRKIFRQEMMKEARGAIPTKKEFSVGAEKTALSAAQFAGVASLGQSFSPEQEALRQMFGGGQKIWGNIREPVRINNDLNSSRSDPFDETADMFGWGPRRERSGLF